MAIMGNKKQMKDMMSENKDVIQENTQQHLFGEKREEQITEYVNLKKKKKKKKKKIQGVFNHH